MATTSIRSITDTWTDGGTTYDAIKMNVTDSASAAASNLLNLQVASSSKLAVGKDGALTVTSAAADAIAVGPNGATNPAFIIDASTASAATGLKIVPNAAASGVALSVVSSGTNENVTVDAKGSGTVTINGTATGAITLARATGVTGAMTGTSTSASALAVGANGATNPVLKVNANTASVATGIEVTGAAAASGVALAVISSGTNDALKIDAKGSGTITLGTTSTGNISAKRALVGDLGITSIGPTAGIGYATGAGGAVTQATNRTTGVTTNTVTGAITTNNTSLAAGASATFTVTNSAVALTDTVVLTMRSGFTTVDTLAYVTTVAAGSFNITVRNNHASTAETGAIILNFAVIKAVAA